MNNKTIQDVVVIGGGAAGSSAALVLGRARASTLLIDDGRPSNAPSSGIGGLLGNDGTAPSDFYERAAHELAEYPSVERRAGTVTSLRQHGSPRWQVELDDGETVATHALLLATGMRYALPDIAGIEPRWGSSVFHCPFCHGWEHRDQPLAVIADLLEPVLLLRRWTDDLTLVTDPSEITESQRQTLDNAGIRVIDGQVTALNGPGQTLESITLQDGTTIAVTGLMLPAPHQLRQPSLLDGLGLQLSPTGHLDADLFGATSVPGIWAAGDLTSPMASVARAIAAGSNAAAAITHHLVANQYGLE